MRSLVFSGALALLLGSAALGQLTLTPDNGGTGVDGMFAPTANMTLDTDVQAVYEYVSFTIPPGVTVTCIGSNPITIKVQGAAQIDGVLDASGVAGATSTNNAPGGAGGANGAGGGAGGEGACAPASPFAGAGQPGLGASPGQPGIDTTPAGSFTDPVGGGGGGGNATAGQDGGPPNAGGASASGLGGAAVTVCRAGSGGGGGGCDVDSPTAATSNDGGGGGGGGGGRLCLYSNQTVVVGANGSILANGGDGGQSAGNGGGGGGGSGGSIELAAPSIVIDGLLSAVGGAGGAATQTNCGCSPGGNGGDGCISLNGDASTSTNLGAATPMPSVGANAAMLTQKCPTVSFLVGGVGAGDPWQVAAAAALAPTGIPIGSGSFLLDLGDSLFAATFPVNTLAPIFTNMSGTGPSAVTISVAGLPTGLLDLTLYFQGAQFTPSVNASNLATLSVKL